MRIETGYVILYLTDRWSVGKERKKMRTVKDAKERRNEILDAAEVLFVSKGYDNTTMKDILEKVQIAKGTLYYHFKSKEDILDAMVERIEERMKEKVKRVINTKKPVLTRVTDAILAMHVSSDIELAMLEEMHKPQNALLHQKSQEETMKWIVPMMETLVEEGIEEGIFTTKYKTTAVEMIMLYSNVMLVEEHMGEGEQAMQKMLGFIDSVERLLGAKEGSMLPCIMQIFEKTMGEMEKDGEDKK